MKAVPRIVGLEKAINKAKQQQDSQTRQPLLTGTDSRSPSPSVYRKALDHFRKKQNTQAA